MTASKRPKTYQQMQDELSKLIEWFESDETNLDEAVEKYELAMQLLKQMEHHLNTAENKVKKIELNFSGE